MLPRYKPSQFFCFAVDARQDGRKLCFPSFLWDITPDYTEMDVPVPGMTEAYHPDSRLLLQSGAEGYKFFNPVDRHDYIHRLPGC